MAKKTKAKSKNRSQVNKTGGRTHDLPKPDLTPLDNLRMIRIFDFNLIPRYLFEQIKGRQWDVDGFLKVAPGLSANPTTLLYVYADKDHVIQGFLWASVNIFTGNIDGQMLSLNKKYWGYGAVPRAFEFLGKIRKTLKFNKVTFRTSRARAFTKYGAKPSASVVMEV